MGIKSFNSLASKNLKYVSVNGCVVIDGNNFFYDMYEYSKIPYTYGCEGDKFAKFVKEYLRMFKRSNIVYYFIFKGGTSDLEKYFTRYANKEEDICFDNYNTGIKTSYTPLYAREIIKEVLDEMKFKYVCCEYESKDTCIAVAQNFSCPVVSYDHYFAMSNIDYIPQKMSKKINNIKINNGNVVCGVFNLDNFMNNTNITIDDFTLFTVLTDDSIFSNDYFDIFFNNIGGSPRPPYVRNIFLLDYLSRNDTISVIDQIIKSNVDKKQLFDALASVKNFLNRKVNGGLPLDYLLGKIKIDKLDPEWFEKGVLMRHIDVSYVNMYRSKVVFYGDKIQDFTQTDPIILSSEIIRYAYDLLTNFKGGEITIKCRSGQKQPIEIGFFTEKPNYDCCTCVFENGWENIKSLNLFQHFISVTLETFDFSQLESAPEDARLLIIALAYFSKQKDVDTVDEMLSILISYVLLSNCSSGYAGVESATEGATSVFQSDYIRALKSLKDIFKESNIKENLDLKVLHPLTEFQHCLHEINKLNILCGKPYKPTVYSRTFNGTFVYQFLLYLKYNDGIKAVNRILHDNFQVLESFNSLWNIITKINLFDNLLAKHLE